MKHRWRLNEDGEVDMFASEEGFHNGPFCEECWEAPCEHCAPGWADLDDCTGRFVPDVPRLAPVAPSVRTPAPDLRSPRR